MNALEGADKGNVQVISGNKEFRTQAHVVTGAALGKDDVHPNLFGYQIMEKIVLETLKIKK